MPLDSANEPAQATDLPSEPSTTGLPRLRVIHLMLWMAATAVAFLPYQLSRQARDRLSPGAAAVSQTIPSMAMGATYGVAAGSCLYVAASLLYWRRKGYTYRLQPGHWFALEGVGQWLMSTVLGLLLYGSGGWAYALQLITVSRLLFGLAFFVCYSWLALRSPQPLRWRFAFAAMAWVPVVEWLCAAIATLTSWFQARTTILSISNAMASGVIGLFLVTAMAGDLIHRTDRHWTHWLSAGMRLATLVASTLIYTYRR
ncbi:MAG: hypothetical protein H0T51_22445 [Pirellulales bacterium]|nr:hypothetical protein [Pirellulales bacterium]